MWLTFLLSLILCLAVPLGVESAFWRPYDGMNVLLPLMYGMSNLKTSFFLKYLGAKNSQNIVPSVHTLCKPFHHTSNVL